MSPRDPSGYKPEELKHFFEDATLQSQFEILQNQAAEAMMDEEMDEEMDFEIDISEFVDLAEFERDLSNIIANKKLEMTRFVGAEERRRNLLVQLSEGEYQDLLNQDEIYRNNHPFSRRELTEKKDAIVQERMEAKEDVISFMYGFLDECQISFVLSPIGSGEGRQYRQDMIGLIEKNLLLWLLDNFEPVNQCPFCIMKFQSEYLAIDHVKAVHFPEIAAEAMDSFWLM